MHTRKRISVYCEIERYLIVFKISFFIPQLKKYSQFFFHLKITKENGTNKYQVFQPIKISVRFKTEGKFSIQSYAVQLHARIRNRYPCVWSTGTIAFPRIGSDHYDYLDVNLERKGIVFAATKTGTICRFYQNILIDFFVKGNCFREYEKKNDL